MAQKIFVIYTDDTKPRRYVLSLSRRSGTIDNNLVAETTTDLTQAHDFGSISNAKTFIPKIHNPFEREYKYSSVKVDRKPSETLTGDLK